MFTPASTNIGLSNNRSSALRSALERKRCLRIMEVSSPLAALVVEASRARDEAGRDVEYDGFWSSFVDGFDFARKA